MWVTLEDAHILARQIKERSPNVLGVELFGSVLRNGKGHDVDFICTVSDEIATKWLSEPSNIRVKWPSELLFAKRSLKKFIPFLGKALTEKQNSRRQVRASNLLGLDLRLLGESYHPGICIEVWLFPSNWRKGEVLNQAALVKFSGVFNERKTLAFFASAAWTAKKIA